MRLLTAGSLVRARQGEPKEAVSNETASFSFISALQRFGLEIKFISRRAKPSVYSLEWLSLSVGLALIFNF